MVGIVCEGRKCMKRKVSFISVFTFLLVVFMTLGNVRAADRKFQSVTDLQGQTSSNVGKNSYLYADSPMKSYLAETDDGVMRVEAIDDTVLIEYYDQEGKVLSSKEIDFSLPRFGGFYNGIDYYYLVFGDKNEDEDNSKTVMRIIKYDKSWNQKGQCDLKGKNTYIPFSSGSLRMTETNGDLYIHTCHLMYKNYKKYHYDDHHQANMTFVIHEDDMKEVDSYYGIMNHSYGYVSHSFNQFIQTDGKYIYRVDQGDAEPRGISYNVTDINYTVSSPALYTTLYDFD